MEYTRVCTTCGVEKPLTEFRTQRYTSGRVGYRSRCYDCTAAKNRARYLARRGTITPRQYKKHSKSDARRQALIRAAQKHGLWKDAS